MNIGLPELLVVLTLLVVVLLPVALVVGLVVMASRRPSGAATAPHGAPPA